MNNHPWKRNDRSYSLFCQINRGMPHLTHYFILNPISKPKKESRGAPMEKWFSKFHQPMWKKVWLWKQSKSSGRWFNFLLRIVLFVDGYECIWYFRQCEWMQAWLNRKLFDVLVCIKIIEYVMIIVMIL